ncbi:MAG TPA: glycine zipper 2TM domain-containing protein [Pseudoxanthomonas sp.]|nr:glycine zipper 2TM domain-containing protein [Pseudoxanthomonas sp.]
MKALAAGLLMLVSAVPMLASAQSSRYYPSDHGSEYDYARVIRVDPIIDHGGYRSASSDQRCYYRQADQVYAGGDGYYRDDGYYGDGYRNDGYRRDGYSDGYRRDQYSTGNETSRTVATVLGGIAGAVLGSKVGDGSGRYVGTAVGSMVGGMAGRSIYDSSQRSRQQSQRGVVRVCDPVPANDYYGDRDGRDDGRVSGYDVTYEYAGRTYRTRTDYHPGDRIRVRVDVRPE